MRIIATEEAFAPPRYFSEYLKLAQTIDTPVSRYLTLYYGKPEVLRQFTDSQVRLTEMDAHGVDMQVLSIAAPGVQAFAPDLASELAVIANDMLAETIARHPGRFAGLAAIAPHGGRAALRELERAIGGLGLNGLLINSHTQGEYLDQPKFWPLLEAAEALGAPLYLHPNFPPDAMLSAYADYGMMGALWGFGADASLHVARLILSGVLDRFPRLQIVLGHLGEALPFWLSRLDNRYANILARGGLEPLGMARLELLPSAYFTRNFHITTSGMMSDRVLQFCLDTVGEERVLFAVDYPYEQTRDAVTFLRGAALDETTRAAIAHGNAERLFRIAAA